MCCTHACILFIASAYIFSPELIPIKTNRDNMKSLSFITKNEQNSPFSYHTLLFYVYTVKLIYRLESYLAHEVFIYWLFFRDRKKL